MLEVQIKEKSMGNPRDLVIISPPKMGKSSLLGAFSLQKNALVLDLEKNGYEYITARVLTTYQSETDGLHDAYMNYLNIRNQLLQNKSQYEFLLIDNLSELDKLSEIGGTYLYMSTTMGKNFNRNPKTGEAYKYSDPEFRLVTTLPDGAGFQHTRKFFLEQIDLFAQISPYRIYAAHIADKYIKDNTREEVVGSEIALTGQLKRIFASKVTTLCKMVAEGNKRLLSFDVANDSVIAGSRAPWLKGQILISEMIDDEIKTYWENIYK